VRIRALLAVALAAASAASAHVVPVLPSTCAFEPVEIRAGGVEARGVAPGPDDAITIRYDPQAGAVQLETTGVPRAFTGGASGSMVLPALFPARLESTGDLTAAGVAVGWTVAGAPAATTLDLTTGVAGADGVVGEGVPFGSDGRFVLVGVLPAGTLPPPLAGAAVTLRLGCTAVPAPDLDQFAVPTRTTGFRGTLGTRRSALRATIRPAPGAAFDPARPAVLRLGAGDETLVALVTSGGLAPRGRRRWVGRSDDGAATITLRRRGRGVYLLTVALGAVTPPAGAGPVELSLAYDVAGLTARARRTFRRNGPGTRLVGGHP
jgi:hypothetical protein